MSVGDGHLANAAMQINLFSGDHLVMTNLASCQMQRLEPIKRCKALELTLIVPGSKELQMLDAVKHAQV